MIEQDSMKPLFCKLVSTLVLIVGLSVSAAEFRFLDGHTEDLTFVMANQGTFMVKDPASSRFRSIPVSDLSRETVEEFGGSKALAFWNQAREQHALEETNKQKGLVLFQGNWITPQERSCIEAEGREAAYVKTADTLIMSKYKAPQRIKILGITHEGHAVARAGGWGASGTYVYASPSFLILNPNDSITSGEVKIWSLYYLGKRNLEIKAPSLSSQPEVYTRTLADARRRVRSWDRLYDNDPDNGTSNGDSYTDGIESPNSGSGILIGQGGFVLTNAHVVQAGSRYKVRNHLMDFNARLLRSDASLDLALLQILPPEGSEHVDQSLALGGASFANPETVLLGDTVYAVGFPAPKIQGSNVKVTKGIVSSLTGFQDDPNTLQMDAAIQPGNSGGPLMDQSGALVGITVARLEADPIRRSALPSFQNVNYAVNLHAIQRFLDTVPGLEFDNLVQRDPKEQSASEAIAEISPFTLQVLSAP